MSEIIRDTGFAYTAMGAVTGFVKALTKRWSERVATDIARGTYDFPQAFERSAGAGEDLRGVWDYASWFNTEHFKGSECAFVAWAQGDQTAPLEGVACSGRTYDWGRDPARAALIHSDRTPIPQQVECGMGRVLARVPDWAEQEGRAIFSELPQFNAHDQDLLEHAHEALLRIGAQLGLSQDGDGELGVDLEAASNGTLTSQLEALGDHQSDGQSWWEGWTGLAADTYKHGFFASLLPTVSNQAAIAGAMSNLFAARMSIIEKARRSQLELINGAALALDSTTEVTVSYVTSWKIMQDLGTLMTIGGAFSAPLGAAGASILLVGMLGEQLNPDGTKLVYSQSLETVMAEAWGNLRTLKEQLTAREMEYESAVTQLRDFVYGIHSFNLEMYDLTENSAEGDAGKREGLTVQVDQVMKIAQASFDCAEMYEDHVIPLLGDVESAEAHLADENGDHAAADTDLIGLLGEFRGFLTTACGRLYTAGEQVKAAAERYTATDEEQRAAFENAVEDWHEEPAPSRAGEWAQDTDRSSYDPEGSDLPGHADPGAAMYETELTGG